MNWETDNDKCPAMRWVWGYWTWDESMYTGGVFQASAVALVSKRFDERGEYFFMVDPETAPIRMSNLRQEFKTLRRVDAWAHIDRPEKPNTRRCG